jgi:hypothetical protein
VKALSSPFDVYLPPLPAARVRDRVAAIALFTCATIVAVSIASFEWFSHGASHVGLAGVWRCAEDGCHTDTWHRMHVPSEVPALGYFAIAALAAAVTISIYAGVMLMRGRPVSTMLVSVPLAIAACATVGFWAEAGSLGDVGPTGFVALAGIAGAAIAVDIAHRSRSQT